MKRLKSEELTKLSDDDLLKRLNDLRSEFATLKSKAARGTLKKQLGEIKSVRRNIARAMTAVNTRNNSNSNRPQNVVSSKKQGKNKGKEDEAELVNDGDKSKSARGA